MKVLTTVLVGGSAAAAMFCGGQIVVDQPTGHADDGGYVLADGAPAFIAGQGCGTYTPSSQLANCVNAQGLSFRESLPFLFCAGRIAAPRDEA